MSPVIHSTIRRAEGTSRRKSRSFLKDASETCSLDRRASTLASVVSLAAVIVLIEASGQTGSVFASGTRPITPRSERELREEGYRYAALTAYKAGGEPGRVCYVSLLKNTSKSGGTFVIWPDNLFDNGALHDYAGPFSVDEGYGGHRLVVGTRHSWYAERVVWRNRDGRSTWFRRRQLNAANNSQSSVTPPTRAQMAPHRASPGWLSWSRISLGPGVSSPGQT